MELMAEARMRAEIGLEAIDPASAAQKPEECCKHATPLLEAGNEIKHALLHVRKGGIRPCFVNIRYIPVFHAMHIFRKHCLNHWHVFLFAQGDYGMGHEQIDFAQLNTLGPGMSKRNTAFPEFLFSEGGNITGCHVNGKATGDCPPLDAGYFTVMIKDGFGEAAAI